MAYKINCPYCRSVLGCEPGWAGRQITCPVCHRPFVVPGGFAPQPSSPPAAVPPSKKFTKTGWIICGSAAAVVLVIIVAVILGSVAGFWGKNRSIDLGNGVKLELIKVSAGSFAMGSPDFQTGHQKDEAQHQVRLTKDYWLGKTEVTQAQWQAVMGTSITEQRDKRDKKYPLFGNGAQYPMYYVSWEEAMDFCRRLNDLTAGKRPAGYVYSLPTEAQWEYACRGGNKSRGYKYSGSNILEDVGWSYENSGREQLDGSDWKAEKAFGNGCCAHAVGQKQPNELGFYDMSGNVCEWCVDRYGSYTGGAVDPTGPSNGSNRVGRGGSWIGSVVLCRSAYRFSFDPGFRGSGLGFRLALVPGQ